MHRYDSIDLTIVVELSLTPKVKSDSETSV